MMISTRVMSMVTAFLFGILLPSIHAQAPTPAPSSDGTSIDQGIAYMLMLVALVLTYLIHPTDAFSPCATELENTPETVK